MIMFWYSGGDMDVNQKRLTINKIIGDIVLYSSMQKIKWIN